jgi:hypothetical protein
MSRRWGRGYRWLMAISHERSYLVAAVRSDVNVNSSDSLGMDVTNGPINQPNPVGMLRLSDTDSHCT